MATIGLYEGRVVVLLGKMSKNKIPKEENGKTDNGKNRNATNTQSVSRGRIFAMELLSRYCRVSFYSGREHHRESEQCHTRRPSICLRTTSHLHDDHPGLHYM
jgi:hypothetical protein